MVFHYSGKYSGDESTLPQRTQEGAVIYREPEDMKKLARIMTITSCILVLLAYVGVCLRVGEMIWDLWCLLGMLLSFVTFLPHEFLHALWFPGDVYMFNNLKQGMLFVCGPGDFGKARFIAMSLCPNVVFGLIPYVLFMIFPGQVWLGILGAFCIGSGAGDYLNVINCARQVPKGGLSFMSGMHTYWYLPDER